MNASCLLEKKKGGLSGYKVADVLFDSVINYYIFVAVQSLSCIQLFATHGLPHTLSFTISQSLLGFTFVELVMLSNLSSSAAFFYFTFNIYEFLICFRELSVSETQGLKSPTATTDVAIYLCSSSFAIRDYVLIYILCVVICSFLSYHWIFVPFIRLHTR